MRRFALLAPAACALLTLACGPAEQPRAAASNGVAGQPPGDESRRFPRAGFLSASVAADHLLDQPFMPGGTLARYRKGQQEYEMFAAKLASPTAAAVLLPDWRQALTGAKLVPSFGGYFGLDNGPGRGRPVFVFSKGPWIAGVAGLPEKDADREARALAARLD